MYIYMCMAIFKSQCVLHSSLQNFLLHNCLICSFSSLDFVKLQIQQP